MRSLNTQDFIHLYEPINNGLIANCTALVGGVLGGHVDCSVGEDEDVSSTEVGSFPAAGEPEEECCAICACAVEMMFYLC